MATSLDKAQPTSDKASDASTLRLPTTHHPTVTSGQTSSTTSFSDTDPKDVEKNELVGDEATKEIAEAAPAVAGQTPPINPMHPSQFPDGGTRAWLVVFGAHCALFVSFGWINCIGVFQAYYETHQLRNYTPQEIAWIPSLEAFCMFIGGLWVGRVYDNFGPKYLLLIGSFLHVFGLMMASISTEYYQFILSQGLCSGTGASMIFYPAMSCVITWFFKKRAFAMGIVAAGSGLGGIIFPIMVERLSSEVGYGWTMRICAFLILALTVIVNLTVVSRIPPAPRPVKIMDFIMPYKELRFSLLAFGSFLMFFGLFLPFNYLILVGAARHVPKHITDYLVPILNAGSIFGRIIPNYAADKLGRFNTFVIASIGAPILILALWLPGSGTAAIVTFSVLFGIVSGTVVSLAPTLVAVLSDVRQIGVRTGSLFSLVAISTLISSPIGGQIIIGDDGSYKTMQICSGCFSIGGAVLFTILRYKMGGWSLTAKV